MKSALATIVLPFLMTASLQAQESSGITLRADTRVVQVDVTVRNSGGKPVEDLKQSDFKILDNGKPRPFTIFSVNRRTRFSPCRGHRLSVLRCRQIHSRMSVRLLRLQAATPPSFFSMA